MALEATAQRDNAMAQPGKRNRADNLESVSAHRHCTERILVGRADVDFTRAHCRCHEKQNTSKLEIQFPSWPPRRLWPVPTATGEKEGKGACIVDRPSQYAAARKSERPLSAKTLIHHFVRDVCTGGLVSGPVPAKNLPTLFRVTQWNVHNLRGNSGCSEWPDPAEILKLALSVNADVIVLNEFYAWDSEDTIKEGLREAGYEFALSETDFPTLLATRVSIADGAAHSVVLHDSVGASKHTQAFAITGRLHRAAVCRKLRLAHSSGSAHFIVYATHLNHIDGDGARGEEAGVLLEHVETQDEGVPILVVGDFNQPRRCDYAPEEWVCLARSAAERNEPEDDGVVGVFAVHGFACSLDLCQAADRNWPLDALPPPTHWTGTAIDYSFARGLCLCGTYVIPTLLSDHFPVVSDWALSDSRGA